MRIPLDRDHPTPLFEQLRAHLRQAIASGGLPPGARLPATRRLALDLGISRLTVERAFAELQAEGLVAGRPGSGTYVCHRLTPPSPPRRVATWPAWQGALPATPAVADEHVEGRISLAGGLGDARLLPGGELRRVLQSVLRRDGLDALGYGDRAGHPGLRATIARLLGSQGLATRADRVLVTSGSQQAIALVSGLLLRPGDAILVERPTYGRALDLFRAQGLRIVGVPVDAGGMRVELLGEALRTARPRLIYTIPNFHNPTGACLSPDRRRVLVALAARHDVPILEDDYVGDLRFEGRALAPLKALDRGGGVVYVSTFSKMLVPGLRIGFLVADGPVWERLAGFKAVHDLATSAFVQRAVDEYVTVGRYEAHLRRSCRAYRQRRDALLAAIGRHLPGVRVEPARGGLFLWARLPDGLSSSALLPRARAEGVSFAPGGAFFPDPADGEPWVRLNFAAEPPGVLEEAARRLGRAMR